MNVKTDDDFIYFNNVTIQERSRLLNFHNAVKVKNGFRVPMNLWSLRELIKDFPQVKSVLEPNRQAKENGLKSLVELKKQAREFVFDKRLRGYQNEDVYYLKALKCAGVFNEQRTGKTPTMISLIAKLFPRTNLIVCPASLVYNWQREFEKWLPNIRVAVVTGTPKKREQIYKDFKEHGGVLVVSKDTLKVDTDKSVYLQTFGMVIVDEAHFLRNYKTAQSKALFKLKAERKYALTGTPTVKHPADIYGILHFLYPKKFTSYWQFAERYFKVEENFMGYNEVLGVKKHRIDELQNIVGIISVQRKRKDVMEWLPQKERITFYCEMTPKQRKAYKEMLDYFFIENTLVDASTILAQLTRLRQICLEPSLLNLDMESGKTEALIDYLKESSSEPIVIMSMFTSFLKLMKTKLESLKFKVGMIHGEMTNKQKMEQAEKFQRGEIDVLLCNIISAGTGFTLDRAETIIFTDKAWNPAENEQAEDRITPTTPDKVHKHTIISFVCQNTVDEKINTLLENKKSLTDIVNEGGLKAIKKLLL
jgi:SNF2 family DNA or RNA helicase